MNKDQQLQYFKLLPNYLKNKIISLLVENDNQLDLLLGYYNSTGEYRSKSKFIKQFPNYSQSRILNYSLVCLEWFQITCNSINTISSSYYEIDNKLNQYVDKQYSLIKSENILKYIHQGYEEDEKDKIYQPEQIIVSKFKNIQEIYYMVPFDIEEWNGLLFRDKQFLNYKFTNISKIRLTIYIIDGQLKKEDFEKVVTLNNNEPIEIDTLKLGLLQETNQESFSTIISNTFKIKRLLIIDDYELWTKHIYFYNLFKNENTKSIEEIKIKNQFIDPYSMVGIDHYAPELKRLNVRFHFHELLFHMQRIHCQTNSSETDSILKFEQHFNKEFKHGSIETTREMIRNYRDIHDEDELHSGNSICPTNRAEFHDEFDEDEAGCIKRTKFALNDWYDWCKSVSACKQLEYLKISEICIESNTIDPFIVGGNDNGTIPEYFTLPLIKLIENTKSIKSLTFHRMSGLITVKVLESFSVNTSIESIDLSGSINSPDQLSYIFNQLIVTNKNIKSITIKNLPSSCTDIVNEFNKSIQFKSNIKFTFTKNEK